DGCVWHAGDGAPGLLPALPPAASGLERQTHRIFVLEPQWRIGVDGFRQSFSSRHHATRRSSDEGLLERTLARIFRATYLSGMASTTWGRDLHSRRCSTALAHLESRLSSRAKESGQER